MNENPFYSKVLLFGEYSVIKNSQALAMPYHLFSGYLSFEAKESQMGGSHESNAELKNFFLYVKHLKQSQKLPFDFDLTSFEFDVGQGLSFKSTIPQGYGVGSSGALTASLYDRYVLSRTEFEEDKNPQRILNLKNDLALLESAFHGKSSGFDPLLSYLDCPLLISSSEQIQPVNLPHSKNGAKGALFILNTKRSRKTEALVNLFLEKLKQADFDRTCEDKLLPATNKCITTFLEGDAESFVQEMESLSNWQFEYLKPMIPTLYQEKWEDGLNSKECFLKLCGAGGGGFLLGYAKDFEKYKMTLDNSEVRVLFKL
ncbi:MAG: mevalonate kinase family protein [Bacteriovoracaceae bacterium]